MIIIGSFDLETSHYHTSLSKLIDTVTIQITIVK